MAVEGHAPTSEPARTIFWVGQGRCPDCDRRPELIDDACPECGRSFGGGVR